MKIINNLIIFLYVSLLLSGCYAYDGESKFLGDLSQEQNLGLVFIALLLAILAIFFIIAIFKGKYG